MPRRSTSRHRSRSRSPKRDNRRRPPISPRHNRSRSADRDSNNDLERLDPPASKVLGVFGLSPSTDEAALRQIFSRFGRIASIHVVYDRGTGRSRGFGFIYFEKIEDAKEARKETQGMKIDGGTVRVAFSLTNKPHEPTPGVYMGTPVSQYIRNDRKSSRRRRSRSRTPPPRRRRSRSRTPRRHRSRSRTPRRYRSLSRSPRRRSRS